MDQITGVLARSGVCVVRFFFPYMEKIKQDGRRRPPDRVPVLIERFRALIADQAPNAERLFIGGKSMGGRIASMIADQEDVDGVVCLGYPFHPPGKPQQLRIEHLAALGTPTLICQGERDPFGNRHEVAGYRLGAATEVAWLPDGEHSFKPRKASGRSWQGNIDLAAERVAAFMAELA
jgi:predicted alpha/beta-hydrolase family hydrolase